MRPDGPVVSTYETDYWSEFKSPWNPKNWSRRVWLIVGTMTTLLVVAIIATVLGVRATGDNGGGNSSYPNYFKLNYTLVDTYSGTSFFDKFNYFTGYDPAGGFVHYVNPGHAAEYNLTYASPSTAIVKVDTTVGPGSDPDASTGRFSVRLESKTQYGPGLFLFDVKHAPYGCATWPALWLADANNWPANGEIDIMEAVNQADTGNLVALHTTGGCHMTDIRREMSGTAGQADCHNATNYNTGCTVTGAPATNGPEFNAGGGGVVALEWRSEGIRAWMFPRDSEQVRAGLAAMPASSGNATTAPDPSTWGAPLADFPATSCDMGRHFRNQSIIVNIDLCGYLTEAVWGSSGCGPSKCTDFVANNPSAFANAYWELGAFQVYKAR